MTELSIEQEFARIDETDSVIRHICEGLHQLNALGPANDRPDVALQLLGQGVERLTKLVLVLGHLENEGLPLHGKDLTKYRHHIEPVLDAVLDLCDRTDYAATRPALKEDLGFLTNDALLRKLIRLLSEFGSGGRYRDLDVLVGGQDRDGPVDAFREIEANVLDAHPEWQAKLSSSDFTGFYPVLYGDLTETIQRYVRALCRMFTLGLLGHRGQQLVGPIQPFLFLMDNDLRTVATRCDDRYPR